ncbi:MAG: O-antigen ligase family protein [Bdellovibrionales bacterium]|nr:O-antigen ligase family protein [Bdellovibrionales bacterium]
MKILVLILSFFLPVSIAGMELFGWLTALVALFHFGVKPTLLKLKGRGDFKTRVVSLGGLRGISVGPDGALWGLWLIAALGVHANGNSETDSMYVIGNFRWIILLYGYSLAWKSLLANRTDVKVSDRSEKSEKPTLLKPSLNFIFLFIWVLTPVLLIVSLYGILQSFTGNDLIRPGREVHSLHLAGVQIFRASGFFNNPMTYAHLFVMWFCVILGLIFVADLPRQQKNWLKLVAVVVGLGLFLSLIRGVWISGTVSVMVMLWFWRRRAFYRGTLAVAIVLGLSLAFVPPVRERVVSIFGTQNIENRDRVTLWAANWEIFKDYPLLGIGYTENERRIGEYYERMGITDGFHGHAHNVYLQFLAGTGLLGLCCYLFFIGYFMLLALRLWRKLPLDQSWARALALGALGAQISLHVGGLTQNNFSDGEVTHNFIFILALLVALAQKHLKVLSRET